MGETLLKFVCEAREMCLERLDYSSRSMTEKELLLGNCRQNSMTLLDVLERQGYNAEIVGGVMKPTVRESRDNINSFSHAISLREPIHFWVNCNGLVCEVASESEKHYGRPIAAKEHPEQLGYIVFEDSYGRREQLNSSR